MTGAYLRAKTNRGYESIEVEYLTPEERRRRLRNPIQRCWAIRFELVPAKGGGLETRSALNSIDLGTGGTCDSSANGDSSSAPHESRNPAGQVTAQTPNPGAWPLKPSGCERAVTSGDVAESRTVERVFIRPASPSATPAGTGGRS